MGYYCDFCLRDINKSKHSHLKSKSHKDLKNINIQYYR